MTGRTSQSETTESKVELIKQSSNGLRGTIVEELSNGLPNFSGESEQLLKFHGIYNQDNRDTRADRKRAGLDIEHICMIRLAIPGGRLLPEQYLAADKLAEAFGNRTLRVTTRQGIQFHFVTKQNVKALIRKVNEVLLSTYAGCGDVVRNVTACPSPAPEIELLKLGELANQISKRYKPASAAYYEIWLDGENITASQATGSGGQDEPLYGASYLPRKFKIGLTTTLDNCIDVLSCDLALAIDERDPDMIHVLVGGGLGRSHSDDTTMPLLAKPLTSVPREKLFQIIDAVISIQRDHGNRADRSHARFKYLVEEWGVDRLRGEVEKRTGLQLQKLHHMEFPNSCDHLGWIEQSENRLAYGIKVPSGRIADTAGGAYRTAIRELVAKFNLSVRFTAKEDVILTQIPVIARSEIIATLKSFGIKLVEEYTGISRSAFACPALPTCGLALTESERFLPTFLESFNQLLDGLTLSHLDIEIRMTGCPNGCARPYLGEIGLVGRSKRSYDIYLCADRAGNRLGKIYAADVATEGLVDALEPIVLLYAAHAHDGEEFGDFCHRWGIDNLKPFAPEPRRRNIAVAQGV
ncbi:MAG: NADPH-dependent assimilatory sulfite reductase hemoprotein subunit [Actinomycetota bacterium]|nr:MAG: NADPH-dependent assimilatory sulfite reductase hemoprotein subunit [Actinomycetota bacterium]